MKPRTKKILNFILIFGTLGIVLLIGFNGVNLNDTLDAFRRSAPEWIAVCCLCYFLYIFFDALCVWVYLHYQGCRVSIPYAFFVAVEGSYYCGITPGSSGGQPMQVYYLSKRSVPIGLSTSALVVKQFCFQFMLFLFDVVLWVGHQDFVTATLGGNRWIFLTGFIYNTFVVALLLLMAVNKRIVHALITFCIKIGTKLHIVKDPESSRVKWEDVMETYHSSIQRLTRHPSQLLVQMLVTCVQMFVYLVIPYCVFSALHTGLRFDEVLTMSSLLFTSAGYTPLPGASGAQEGFFSLFFSPMCPSAGVIFPALLLWRFFTYYITLIVGGITSVFSTTIVHRGKKEQSVSPNSAQE